MTIEKRMLATVAVLFLLSACTQNEQLVPNPSTFKLDTIPEFSSSNSISLVNDQPSTDNVLFMAKSADLLVISVDLYTNLHAWTNAAIAITKRELTNRGMKVAEDESKELKLSILSANGTAGMWVHHGVTSLRAETGSGYVNTYIGDNRSPAGAFRAADGAVMRAVAEMLKDEKIVEYLAE